MEAGGPSPSAGCSVEVISPLRQPRMLFGAFANSVPRPLPTPPGHSRKKVQVTEGSAGEQLTLGAAADKPGVTPSRYQEAAEHGKALFSLAGPDPLRFVELLRGRVAASRHRWGVSQAGLPGGKRRPVLITEEARIAVASSTAAMMFR